MTVHVAAIVTRMRRAETIIPVRSSWRLEHRESAWGEVQRAKIRARVRATGETRARRK